MITNFKYPTTNKILFLYAFHMYIVLLNSLSEKKTTHEDLYHYLMNVVNFCTLPSPFDSIRDAVFTVSPNKQYLGILRPTTPATTEPM